jgi:hypothetical protein
MKETWQFIRSYELEKLAIFLAIVLWPWWSQ